MRIRRTDELDGLGVWSASGRRGSIVGNPHTHPGRFDVLWDGADRAHATSLPDLSRVSESAESWLAGFFAGQSPDASEVLDDVDDFLTSAQRDQWLDVSREFQESGVMPSAWRARRAVLDEE